VSDLRAGWAACRALTLSQLREQPVRVLATVLAIALGVALGVAVYLINTAALGEFDQATRRLIGQPDLIVRGAAAGFDESLFAQLAREPSVALASPVLELPVSLVPASRAALRVLGLDPFRATALQPDLIGALGPDITRLFAHDAIVLSRAAADELELARGDRLPINVDGAVQMLQVIDVLPEEVYPEPLGVMDIAAAQWTLARLGRINRIDLRLRPGVDPARARERLSALLPAGVLLVNPRIERGRASTATRAYRVNLGVLALVALLTGGFVVFSTQWLSIMRRRTALGLLRALGLTRTELQLALLAETAGTGVLGAALGVALGLLLALILLHSVGADLGNAQLAATGVRLRVQALPLLGFALIGTLAAIAGGAIPAWQAAQRAPALALKAGDAEQDLRRIATTIPGVALVATGALLAWLPPLGGLPVSGYCSIAALLIGSVLLVPALTQGVLTMLPRTGEVVTDTAFAQLKGSLSSASVSLASIIVSFSLMVAMAIMVHSFRDSFELWLAKLLPADIQFRTSFGGDTATVSPELQARIAALDGVARAEFRRTQSILLRADRPPVTLIARELSADRPGDTLPLIREAPRPRDAAALPPAWISEAVTDLYGYQPGERIELPLAGRQQKFFIAGIWRDYVRSSGAIVIRRQDYIGATSDRAANEGALWRAPHADPEALRAAIRATLGSADTIELVSSEELRQRSLLAFDRAFLVTYALEAIAVLIGLLGVSVAASGTALSRRAQFGVLRHLGLLRRQVLWMFAGEGVALSVIAVLYGLLLGALLSLILVYVINRQSFHWSIDLAVPWSQLAGLSLSLIAASALTSLWSGRAAVSRDPIRAVREDW
jgi:putative ABC transport system permease protein